MASDIHADGTNLIWKCMNCGTATIAVVLVTLEKSTIPNAKASKYPAIIPKITVPVTTSGNSFLISFTKIPKMIATIPPIISAPSIVPISNSPQ